MKRHMTMREMVVALAASLAILLMTSVFYDGFSTLTQKKAFSHEVTFTDDSKGGLAIMPASCASNPGYYHASLSTTTDASGYSFVSQTGQTEYGAYGCYGGNGSCATGGTGTLVYICTTNTSGSSYYIPANTAAELNAVKALGTTIPGLQIW